MNTINPNNRTYISWNILLLLIQIWLGIMMIKSGNCVIDIFTSPSERAFFANWFGKELHFPAPIFMAVLAKGAEFIGGILLIPGLFTGTAAAFIGITMIVATLTANLGENFNIDGSFTIMYFLLAAVLVIAGGGKYSLDYGISSFKRKKVKFKTS